MINLLPTHIKEERMYGRRNRNLLGYSIALLGTAGVTAAIMVGSLQFVGSDEPKLIEDIEVANIEIQALEGSIQEVETVARRLETAKDLSGLSVQFSDLIPRIGAVLPEGVILNALSLTGGITDPLLLDVDIASADLAPILSRNLVESDLFEAADILSLTPKGITDGGSSEEGGGEPVEQSDETYKFSASLTASFTGSADAKKKESAAAAAQAEAAAQEQGGQ